MESRIDRLIAQLQKEGIKGLPEYRQRLVGNASNPDVLADLIFEARAALMFRRHGFGVAIREESQPPDLLVELDNEIVYTEVKHFREKEQDLIDKKAMQESEDLVPVGNVVLLEGIEAWQQIANVAIRKANQNQYLKGSPNLLVIASDSNSISGIILSTTVKVYDEQVCKSSDLRLRRLNGLILMDQWIWPGDRLEQLIGAGNRSVIFCPTAHVTVPLSSRLRDALVNMREW